MTMKLEAWNEALADVMPRVEELRRQLHRHPEVGDQEAWTQGLILDELKKLDIEAFTFKDCYGVMGLIHNGKGRCVAIRADMDALPVTEKTGLPFASEQQGVMHACGHDTHMALLLGSAMWLQANRDKWRGTVKLFFEPAEETHGGAKMMVEQGCLDNPKVDYVIGQHMNPNYDAGVFFAKPGYVSGASDTLKLTVHGRQCHGAYPESGVDAIVIAAQIVTALQSLVSRTVSPLDSAVITFGTVSGGHAGNVICDEVMLTGTMRTLSDVTREALKMRMTALCENIAVGMGGWVELRITPGYGAVYNDDAAYAAIEAGALDILGEGMLVRREKPSLGVESFCYFLKDTPGVYYDLGSGKGTALHTDTFCVDEACLLPGVALQCESTLRLLKED